MGNHTVDCDLCGEDRRTSGDNCCAARAARDTATANRRKNERQQADDFLKLYGLDKMYFGGFGANEYVADGLRDLIKRGLLKDLTK